MSKKKPNGVPVVPIPDALKGVISRRLDDPAAKESFPGLLDLMLPKYADGKQVTQEGRITIAIRGSHWEVRLDLPTYVLQCVVIPRSLQTALEDLERAIASEAVVWSPGYSRTKKKIPTLDET